MRKVNCLYLKLRIILFYPNQFVVMKDALGGSSSALGIVDHLGKKVKKLIFHNEQVWGIRPRNVQQIMGLELLLREDIPLVTLTGKAGTGKTLLALASGLMQTEDLGLYKKITRCKTNCPSRKRYRLFTRRKRRKVKTMDATNF